MTSPTRSPLSSQASTACALLALIDQFPDLPAASFDVPSARTGERLDIHVHDDPTAFEQWREALHLDPESAELRTFYDFSAITVHGEFEGTPVRLVGYLPPVPNGSPDPLAA